MAQPQNKNSPVPSRQSQLAPQQFAGLVRNISNAYQGASPQQKEEGSGWYGSAHDQAAEIGRKSSSGVSSDEQGAGIVAALSPNTRWSTNINNAREFAANPSRNFHTGDQMDKVRAIHEGAHPLDVLHGHKERSFYHNIAHPEDPFPVTVDRHAHDIATGFRPEGRTHEDSGDRGLQAGGRYQIFGDAYRAAAHHLDIPTANEVQAVTWVRQTQEHGGSRGGRKTSDLPVSANPGGKAGF